MYKLRYSPEALRDLEKLFLDVIDVSQDFETATKYLGDIKKKIGEQKKHPKTGTRLLIGNAFTGYYFVKYKAYLVFYRVVRNEILVVRILPEKSDYKSKLI